MSEALLKLMAQGAMPNKSMDELAASTSRQYRELFVGAPNTATTVIAETVGFKARMPCVVADVLIIPAGTVSRDDTNYSTITVAKRTAALPGTNVDFIAASYKLTGGSFGANESAFVEHSYSSLFDADITKRIMVKGDYITLKAVATGGTGTSLPAGTRLVALIVELST